MRGHLAHSRDRLFGADRPQPQLRPSRGVHTRFRYDLFMRDQDGGARHAKAFRVRREAFHDPRVQRNAVGKRGAAAGERGLTRQADSQPPSRAPGGRATGVGQPGGLPEEWRAHVRPMASSATASALAPGPFCTGTPRAVHAATSMLAVPTRARARP